MISLKLTETKEETERFFAESGISQNENSLCLVAKQGENTLGFCLFDIDGKKGVIRYIEPLGDLSLADGILRSALHVCAERFVLNVFYDGTADEDFFRKLGFIKDKTEKTLDVDKLFRGCGCHEGEKL